MKNIGTVIHIVLFSTGLVAIFLIANGSVSDSLRTPLTLLSIWLLGSGLKPLVEKFVRKK